MDIRSNFIYEPVIRDTVCGNTIELIREEHSVILLDNGGINVSLSFGLDSRLGITHPITRLQGALIPVRNLIESSRDFVLFSNSLSRCDGVFSLVNELMYIVKINGVLREFQNGDFVWDEVNCSIYKPFTKSNDGSILVAENVSQCITERSNLMFNILNRIRYCISSQQMFLYNRALSS